MILRAADLPDCGGTPATVLLTATADQWCADTGLVTLGHGSLVSVPQAKKMAGGDPLIVPIVLGKAKEIIAYGTGQRLFNKPGRFAIYARDKGCTWPGCDAPPPWCEIHHIDPWAAGRKTSVDIGALICGRHHDYLDYNGWVGVMINGRPYYIPPSWIDSEQTPRRNTRFDDPVSGSY
jgi:hypothetical protein